MRRAWYVAGLILVLGSCTADDRLSIEPRGAEPPIVQLPPVKGVPAPLPAAHCEIQVDGVGLIDMETDYLPHVIVCENGGANLEALKAQAIAARSVAYYAIETSGGICDSQGCQVYSCSNNPTDIHYQAVEETSGMYLLYNDTLTYGFYVAGDNGVAPPACIGSSGSTEGWVTYNEGKTGTDVQQTALGFIHDPGDNGYGQNRGCMSQWGARCLENHNGYDYLEILRFFYGDDIALTQGAGECVIEMEPPGDDTGAEATTDDTGEGDPSTSSDPGEGGGTSHDPDLPGEDDGPEEGSEGSGGGGAALPDDFGPRGDGDASCACRSSERSHGPWMLGWAVLLAFTRRRSRTRRTTKNAASA